MFVTFFTFNYFYKNININIKYNTYKNIFMRDISIRDILRRFVDLEPYIAIYR